MTESPKQTSPYIPPSQYPEAPDWEMTLRIIAGRGIFERQSFDNFMRQVSNRDIAIDVGAHVGSWTIGMSRLFSTVVSFEPHPANRAYLKKNIERAKANNVLVYPQALVDQSRLRQQFAISAAGTTRNSGMPYLSHADSGQGVPVNCATLDSFANNLSLAGRRVGAIKVDVEGLELAVVMGGRKIIDEFKPAVMLEINGWCERYDIHPDQVFDHMSDLGYRVAARSRHDYVFTPKNLRSYTA